MYKLMQIFTRTSKNNSAVTSAVRLFSTPTTYAEVKNVEPNLDNEKQKYASNEQNKSRKTISAVFANLRNSDNILTPLTDKRIIDAATVDELLSISEGIGITRRHILKVVSVLADWTSKGKVELSEFEKDPRFIKLCRLLTKTHDTPRSKSNMRSDDLSTILTVTADDEAAKLVDSITLPQMLKVMTTLKNKKRRSLSLLRALSFNISKSKEKLNLKQSADLLYSMSALSFPDENLFQKITSDVIDSLNNNIEKTAAIGSTLTSLGLLKYKNKELLEALSEWILKNHPLCRTQDILSLFLTLAVLNYEPSNFDKICEAIIPNLSPSDVIKPSYWLDFVWSLVILNKASKSHIEYVLSPEFVNKIEEGTNGCIPQILKLLNIEAASKIIYKYEVTKLDDKLRSLVIPRSKEKQEFHGIVMETLKNLMDIKTYVDTNINTQMGFYIDARFRMDKKCNPIKINENFIPEQHLKVALMIYDYNDICKGTNDCTGINALAAKLLQSIGYKLLVVSYKEFKPTDKLTYRVKYLENKLKTLIT